MLQKLIRVEPIKTERKKKSKTGITFFYFHDITVLSVHICFLCTYADEKSSSCFQLLTREKRDGVVGFFSVDSRGPELLTQASNTVLWNKLTLSECDSFCHIWNFHVLVGLLLKQLIRSTRVICSYAHIHFVIAFIRPAELYLWMNKDIHMKQC